jgi:hypothetical protein
MGQIDTMDTHIIPAQQTLSLSSKHYCCMTDTNSVLETISLSDRQYLCLADIISVRQTLSLPGRHYLCLADIISVWQTLSLSCKCKHYPAMTGHHIIK